MNFSNNCLVLSFFFLVPSTLKAMEGVTQTAKWTVWTRFYLERKHDSGLKTSFFGGDAHYAIDAQGNASFDPPPERGQFYNERQNPNSAKLTKQAEALYSADVSMTKAELDGAGEISRLVYQYSVLQEVGGKIERVAGPTPLAIKRLHGMSSDRVEKIVVENIEPFDLYFTANIYKAEEKKD